MMMTMLLMISMALPMKMMTMTTTILALENLKEQENRVDDEKPNCITSLYT